MPSYAPTRRGTSPSTNSRATRPRPRFAALVAAGLLFAGCATSGERLAKKLSGDPELLYEGALSAMGSGDTATARARLLRAIELQPKNGRFHRTLASVEILRRNYPGALAAADAALLLDPSLTDAHNSRGLVFLNSGRAPEAESEFRLVLADKTFFQKINPRFNLALALLRQGKSDEALAELSSLQTDSPDLPRLWAIVGEARESKGELDKAVANYIEALRRNRKDVDAALRLGSCLERLGKPDLARRYYAMVIETSPASPEAERARGALAALPSDQG